MPRAQGPFAFVVKCFLVKQSSAKVSTHEMLSSSFVWTSYHELNCRIGFYGTSAWQQPKTEYESDHDHEFGHVIYLFLSFFRGVNMQYFFLRLLSHMLLGIFAHPLPVN